MKHIPFELPKTATLALPPLSFFNHLAASMTSSYPFCLLPLMAAECQSMPYSFPPRMPATATTPPMSMNVEKSGSHFGSWAHAKPPYAKSRIGGGVEEVEEREMDRWWEMCMGMRVPSREG